jgi:hypothetical protein
MQMIRSRNRDSGERPRSPSLGREEMFRNKSSAVEVLALNPSLSGSGPSFLSSVEM